MRPAVAFQSTPVLLDRPDREGQLVFADGQLVALLVRLDGDAPSDDLVGFSKPVLAGGRSRPVPCFRAWTQPARGLDAN
jgi:hypothetical protein